MTPATTPSELAAVVADALLARGYGLHAAATAAGAAVGALAKGAVLLVGDLAIDLDGRAVTVGGDPVELRPKEYDLLVALADNADRVVTHDDLATLVWGDAPAPESTALRWHIMGLRRKLGQGRWRPVIETVARVGYRLAGPGRATPPAGPLSSR